MSPRVYPLQERNAPHNPNVAFPAGGVQTAATASNGSLERMTGGL
jgi:hypothetical protein